MCDPGMFFYITVDGLKVKFRQDGNGVKPAFTEKGQFFVGVTEIDDEAEIHE